MAVSIAQALAVVLIERVPSTFTRFSAPTWSTPGRPCRKERKASFDRVTSANGSGRVPGAALGSASAFGSSTWVMFGILHSALHGRSGPLPQLWTRGGELIVS